jgi:hypothetical protein
MRASEIGRRKTPRDPAPDDDLWKAARKYSQLRGNLGENLFSKFSQPDTYRQRLNAEAVSATEQAFQKALYRYNLNKKVEAEVRECFAHDRRAARVGSTLEKHDDASFAARMAKEDADIRQQVLGNRRARTRPASLTYKAAPAVPANDLGMDLLKRAPAPARRSPEQSDDAAFIGRLLHYYRQPNARA